jgi:hypothetical protein
MAYAGLNTRGNQAGSKSRGLTLINAVTGEVVSRGKNPSISYAWTYPLTNPGASVLLYTIAPYPPSPV